MSWQVEIKHLSNRKHLSALLSLFQAHQNIKQEQNLWGCII